MKYIKNALILAYWKVRFLLPVFFVLLYSASHPVQADYIKTSSVMSIGNLSFSFNDPNAQWQWTDVWYSEVNANAADTNGTPIYDSNSLLGDNGTIQAIVNLSQVHSQADYDVVNGDQVGLSSNSGVIGVSYSDIELTEKLKQADSFSISNYDNFFVVTDKNDPGNQGPVEVLIQLDYNGKIFGTADTNGFFVDITHSAYLGLLDALSGDELTFDFFYDSISGTNTTITHNNSSTLKIPYTLNYNTEYLLFAQADGEVYGYTANIASIPEPTTLYLVMIGVFTLTLVRFRKC